MHDDEEFTDSGFPETIIDGVRYTFNPLMAKAARENLVSLVQKFGPVFGQGLGKLDKVDGIMDMDVDLSNLIELVPKLAGSFGAMVVQFCQTLTPSYYTSLVDQFVTRVERHESDDVSYYLKGGKREIFARNLLLESRLLVWAIEEQYKDFFELWKSDAMKNFSDMMKKQAQQSGFQGQSTGGSTE